MNFISYWPGSKERGWKIIHHIDGSLSFVYQKKFGSKMVQGKTIWLPKQIAQKIRIEEDDPNV